MKCPPAEGMKISTLYVNATLCYFSTHGVFKFRQELTPLYPMCSQQLTKDEKNETLWSKISPERQRHRYFTLLYVWVSISLWVGFICFQCEFRLYRRAMHIRFLQGHSNTWLTLFWGQKSYRVILLKKITFLNEGYNDSNNLRKFKKILKF